MNSEKNVWTWSVIILTIFALSACTILLSPRVHAQLQLPGIERSLSIRYEPRYPKPGETALLTVSSTAIDLAEAEIEWRLDGKALARGVGTDTATITLGGLGIASNIQIFVRASDEAVASGEATITPTEIDLLVDSDSYVPSFYRGRGRLSTGTSIKLEAIPHFILPNKTNAVNPDIIFTWRINNEVIASASGRGRATATITIQNLFGSDALSVEARTIDGRLSGMATISLTPSDPILLIYQNHPLFGIMYHRALGSATSFSESELTLTAIPYFSQATDANDPLLKFDWRVNGQNIPQDTFDQNSLTLNADNSNGVALLQLELTHATNIYLNALASWNVTLSASELTQNQFGAFDQ